MTDPVGDVGTPLLSHELKDTAVGGAPELALQLKEHWVDDVEVGQNLKSRNREEDYRGEEENR